jgi:hypothetical protein
MRSDAILFAWVLVMSVFGTVVWWLAIYGAITLLRS